MQPDETGLLFLVGVDYWRDPSESVGTLGGSWGSLSGITAGLSTMVGTSIVELPTPAKHCPPPDLLKASPDQTKWWKSIPCPYVPLKFQSICCHHIGVGPQAHILWIELRGKQVYEAFSL